ncbi:MAG: nitrous oxide-stimulated promoter family protein [Bacteroides sp.]|nr:nitrous oxide-stimulated promoter family protein [Bacteroides sp.]
MTDKPGKIEREKAVIVQMVAAYCRRRHHGAAGELCTDCRELLDYACRRLEHCSKGERKSSCRKCEIHCYSPSYRQRMRSVMKYVGPRMLLINPIAAIRHMLSELR